MRASKTEKRQEIDVDSLLTSYQVGAILQVNPSSVNKWVKDGRIEAFRTPGGHHRIRAGDLVQFLHEHSMPVPRKLENADRRRVLIVDDDPKQLEAIERLFKPYERYVELRMIEQGVDALVQVGSFRPHLIILDIVMPGVDGIEVCERLKGMPETEEMKVVLASGQLTPENEERGKQAGAALILQKPIEVDRILDLMEIRREVAMSA